MKTGIDNISSVDKYLRGARAALLTGPTGVTRDMVSSIEYLRGMYNLVALFACEHGVRGSVQAGEHVGDDVDAATGLPVVSLYGENRRMTEEMTELFDVLIYDIQDVGARFYTYIYTLSFAMEACAKAHKRVVILDRPNPLGGYVEGTLLDERFASFVGEYAIPTRYGLTVGEYARFIKNYLKLDLDLEIAPLVGWRREMLWRDTGLSFVPPSPNIPTPETALSYIGACVFEGTNISEGRGTTSPFMLVGAPWLDGAELTRVMRGMGLPGVLFRECAFTPTFSKYQGETVSGIYVHATDPREFKPFETWLIVLDEIRKSRPDKFEWLKWGEGGYSIDKILGCDAFRLGESAQSLIARNRPLIEAFAERSREYWLY